jgi:Family of unknown function (DUF6282)
LPAALSWVGTNEETAMIGAPTAADEVAELMVGGIDIHIHSNPHLFPEIHSQDVTALAAQAKEAGMRALLVKDGCRRELCWKCLVRSPAQ